MYCLEPKKTIKEINKAASVLLHPIQDPIIDCPVDSPHQFDICVVSLHYTELNLSD